MVLSSSVIISMTLNWMIMCELFQFNTSSPHQGGVFGDLLECLCVGKTSAVSIWRFFFNLTSEADHKLLISCRKGGMEIIACDCFLTISDDNQ